MKKVLITAGITATSCVLLGSYYAIGNYRYNKEIDKLKKSDKMDFQINSNVIHKTLEKENYSVHYFVSGNTEGETILFLHPAFGDHRCFDKQIDCFSTNFRIITVDMAGHGLTGAGKSNKKIVSTSASVEEILTSENITNVHIVGVSLGSLLAQDFALKYPEKVLSLTALGGYNINREQKEIAKSQRGEIFKWLFKMIFSMDAFRRYVASTTVMDTVEQARFYESAKLFTRKSFTVMQGLDKLIENRPNLKRNYPLLILAGEKDAELALRSAKRWHDDEPDSHFYVIENAGHCANMDNAERFNELLINFLTNMTTNE